MDPRAWLHPIYARLSADHTFSLLSPSHQFQQLIAAVAVEHPSNAAELREWSPAAQDGLLLHLASCHKQKVTGDPLELWRVRKGERELTCLAVYLPIGVDVRLMEGEDFRRTRLVRDAIECTAVSDEWKRKLNERGWAMG